MPRRTVPFAKRKKVFVADASKTSTGKTSVSFGVNLNLRKNNRQFRRRADALKFAKNKAKKMGLKTVLLSSNLSGTRSASEVRVR